MDLKLSYNPNFAFKYKRYSHELMPNTKSELTKEKFPHIFDTPPPQKKSFYEIDSITIFFISYQKNNSFY